MRRARRLLIWAALGFLLPWPRPAAGEIDWAPPRPKQTFSVAGIVRPFFHLLEPGWGILSSFRAAYYFEIPLVVAIEASPVAFVHEVSGGGSINHFRAHAAYADDIIEVGAGIGARIQKNGQNGLSLAGTLRLGAIDGLHFTGEYVHSLVSNYYTRRRDWRFSSTSGNFAVPFGPRTAFELEGGLGLDFWAYATLGLRHRIRGTGGPGTLDVRAGAGAAWIIDRFPCQYQDPTPCVGAAGAMGPTITAGVEYRF
jgi:hypothetical protein